jgi:UDPglucose 6-dehydrogenase
MSALYPGVCFSDFGHDVVCVDKDPREDRHAERGEVPIYEPGLDAAHGQECGARGGCPSPLDLAKRHRRMREAMFIAVGTPTRRGDGHADLTYVMAAAEEIRRAP